MAAVAWTIHDRFKEYQGDNTIDLDNDSFVVRLYTSASNIATTSVGDATTATNELSTANGYTAGGDSVAATWTRATSTTTFDIADAVWNASGGSITARFAAIVDTTTTPDEVVAHSLLDDTPADVTATDGNEFRISTPAGGAFALTSTP